jgi:hypothetical protein
MKLISKLAFVVAVALTTSTVSAGTLYWQITSDTGVDFSIARLVVTDGSTTTYLPNSDGVLASDFNDATGTGTQLAMQQTDISAYTGSQYSFFVEMVNYASDPESVTQGDTYSYQDLLTAGYVSFGADDVTAVTIAAQGANLGGSSAVPEPSSGLLLVIGGAMLALRRRRQK